MGNIFTDIAATVKLVGEARKAREAGGSAVEIKTVHVVPLITPKPVYINTIEGCLIRKCSREADNAVREVFLNLPYETQRALEFTPKEPGEWVARAKFWQEQLKPALPPEMYHAVMVTLINRYSRCLKMRKGATA